MQVIIIYRFSLYKKAMNWLFLEEIYHVGINGMKIWI